jgi:hypothetical protein
MFPFGFLHNVPENRLSASYNNKPVEVLKETKNFSLLAAAGAFNPHAD